MKPEEFLSVEHRGEKDYRVTAYGCTFQLANMRLNADYPRFDRDGFFAHGPSRYELTMTLYTMPPDPPARPKRSWARSMGLRKP